MQLPSFYPKDFDPKDVKYPTEEPKTYMPEATYYHPKPDDSAYHPKPNDPTYPYKTQPVY